MKATQLLQQQLKSSKLLTTSLLADLADAPLTAPTPNGGNHPLWIAGHIVYSEARLTSEMMYDKPNPLVGWKEQFCGGSQPSEEASHYTLTIPDILAKWDEVRANTLSILEGISDEGLDQPIANCPSGREALFDSFGKVFTMIATHPLMHRGQLADARRALGRPPLLA